MFNKFFYSLLAVLAICIYSANAANNYHGGIDDDEEKGGNKSLRINGTATVVEDGFEVTFLETGFYHFCVKDEEGNVVVSRRLLVIANRPVFIRLTGVNPDEDTIDLYF
ncbi:MAG: hypothetical protein II951_11400 [Bacteroidales bacterium]|nr:hypothetical protein [Bacteroidales bacterium]